MGLRVVAEVANPKRRPTKSPNTTVLGIVWKQVVTTVNYRKLRNYEQLQFTVIFVLGVNDTSGPVYLPGTCTTFLRGPRMRAGFRNVVSHSRSDSCDVSSVHSYGLGSTAPFRERVHPYHESLRHDDCTA